MKNIPVIRIVAEKPLKYDTKTVNTPEVAAEILDKFMDERCSTDRENFITMCLDTKNRVVALNIVSTGTLNKTSVHPREVFKPVLLANSAAIILAHNHPSGDVTASKEDVSITTRLDEAGKLLGIQVLDHLIIGNGHMSMKAAGLF